MDCVFCRVIAGELPSWRVYEDDHVLAILDLSPVHKGHTLFMPKKHFPDFASIEPEYLQLFLEKMQKVVQKVMKAMDAEGCSVTTANGAAAGQTVFHNHWHIVPRFHNDGLALWPQGGTYAEGEKDSIAEKIRNSF